MSWRVPVLATALLLTAALALGLGGPVVGGSADADPLNVDAEASDPSEHLETWIRIELRSNGDADWRIEYRFNVSTPAQEAAFEELAAAVRAGQVDHGVDQSLFEGYRDEADPFVDRDMYLVDSGWSAFSDGEVGVLTFEVTWTNFAETTEDRVIVGDAFQSEDGTWFEGIDDQTRLTIDAPPGYAVESSPPDRGVENGRITWHGPATFEPGYIEIRYIVGELAPPDDGFGLLIAVVLGVGLLLLTVLAVFGYRRTTRSPGTGPVGTATNHTPAEDDLISDEERVEQLLADHGGRMKQATIVEETGWSNAKVSQLLTKMADDDRVEKLRLGRENLISLPDHGTD